MAIMQPIGSKALAMSALFAATQIAAPLQVHAEDRQDEPRGIIAVRDCKSLTDCPLLDDAYARTPALRHSVAESLRHGGETVPEWLRDKLPYQNQTDSARRDPQPAETASPMVPLRIDDAPYAIGKMRDPENARHEIVVLYDIVRGIATVRYRSADGDIRMLGDADNALTAIVGAYVDPDSTLARQLAEPSLPVMLKREDYRPRT